MDSLSEQIGKVLSDPESLKTITSLAKSLSLSDLVPGDGDKKPPRDDGAQPPLLPGAVQKLAEGNRERTALLAALRPFVRPEKQKKLDQILQTMKLLDLLNLTTKSL